MLTRSLHKHSSTAVSAKGHYVTLDDGRRILDASGGAAVASIGHGNQRVKQAVLQQMDNLSYANSTIFINKPGKDLADHLIKHSNEAFCKVYFVSSGSEAMEAALKLARQYFIESSPPQRQRKFFISRKGSYHGITLGSLSVSGHAARRAPYEEILANNTSQVSSCNEYRDKRSDQTVEQYVSELQSELEAEILRLGHDKVCAFILEPVVGAALGCVPAVQGYLQAVRSVCDKYGVLLIYDEVMCGMGRSGTYHAWMLDGVPPDIQTIGKGLGGGYLPLAGLLINERVISRLEKGSGAFAHGQTFQGHPVACAAALEVQKIILEENLVHKAQSLGSILQELLIAKIGQHPHVGDIRGRGLFWGVELVKDKDSKQPFAREHSVSVRFIKFAAGDKYQIALYPGSGSADGLSGDHFIFAPAFNTTEEEILTIVETATAALKDFFSTFSFQ